MFMRYYGGAVGHQRGRAGHSQQTPSVVPEPITELNGKVYDHGMGHERDTGASPVAVTRDSDSEREGSDDERSEGADVEDESVSSEDNDDDDDNAHV